MHLIYEEYKPTIIAKLIFLPFFLYLLFDRNDMLISIGICLVFSFLLIITPPLVNLKLSPLYHLIDDQGVHVISFWGLKKRSIEWSEVNFQIKKQKVYLYESNGECIFSLGIFKSIRNLEQIIQFLNVEHPDYGELIKFKNSACAQSG